MTAPMEPREPVFSPSTRPPVWNRFTDRFGLILAWAARQVRHYGPYFGIAALLLGFYNVKLYRDDQVADSDRSLAADIISCNIGNARLSGNINGTAQALAEITFVVLDALDIDVDPNEIRDRALVVARESYEAQPELHPRDCSSIPTLTLPVLPATTTTTP